MSNSTMNCFKCGEPMNNENELFGYPICHPCEKKFPLMRDETIDKHRKSFAAARKLDNTHPSYLQNVEETLRLLERDFVAKRIKLLHIQQRLNSIK